MDGTVITFNVGGSFFTTTRETLFKEPSSRLAYIARGTIPCVRDSQVRVTRHAAGVASQWHAAALEPWVMH